MRKLHNEELNRLNTEQYKLADKSAFVVVLDNIRSLNNIGSIFRTADAFRAECIYLCGITAKPPHREIHKTALGATESVNWEYFSETKNCINHLLAKDYSICIVEQTNTACPLQEFQPPGDEKLALVFGNEVKGIDNNILQMADFCIEIPQFGTKHSLNVSVSAGIVIWSIYNVMYL